MSDSDKDKDKDKLKEPTGSTETIDSLAKLVNDVKKTILEIHEKFFPEKTSGTPKILRFVWPLTIILGLIIVKYPKTFELIFEKSITGLKNFGLKLIGLKDNAVRKGPGVISDAYKAIAEPLSDSVERLVNFLRESLEWLKNRFKNYFSEERIDRWKMMFNLYFIFAFGLIAIGLIPFLPLLWQGQLWGIWPTLWLILFWAVAALFVYSQREVFTESKALIIIAVALIAIGLLPQWVSLQPLIRLALVVGSLMLIIPIIILLGIISIISKSKLKWERTYNMIKIVGLILLAWLLAGNIIIGPIILGLGIIISGYCLLKKKSNLQAAVKVYALIVGILLVIHSLVLISKMDNTVGNATEKGLIWAHIISTNKLGERRIEDNLSEERKNSVPCKAKADFEVWKDIQPDKLPGEINKNTVGKVNKNSVILVSTKPENKKIDSFGRIYNKILFFGDDEKEKTGYAWQNNFSLPITPENAQILDFVNLRGQQLTLGQCNVTVNDSLANNFEIVVPAGPWLINSTGILVEKGTQLRFKKIDVYEVNGASEPNDGANKVIDNYLGWGENEDVSFLYLCNPQYRRELACMQARFMALIGHIIDPKTGKVLATFRVDQTNITMPERGILAFGPNEPFRDTDLWTDSSSATDNPGSYVCDAVIIPKQV